MKYVKVKAFQNGFISPENITEEWITSRDDLMGTAYEIACDALGINGFFDDYISDAIEAATDESLVKYIEENYDSFFQHGIDFLKKV